MEERLIPGDPAQLGAEIRSARENAHLSLRRLAELAGVPPSTLSRLELGQTKRPSVAAVREVDRILESGGRWTLAAQRLEGRRPQPRQQWVHLFPQEHVGVVSVAVRPAGRSAGELHRVRLEWGPWTLVLSLRPGRQGAAVWFMKKYPDRVPLRVHVAPSAWVAFEVHDLPPVGADDANRGWVKVE